jgi:hypothetical protein
LLLCSAALVLPALMRLIVPAVGEIGGGGSGLAAAAGVAAVGAQVGGMVATGGASGAAGAGAGGGIAAAAWTVVAPELVLHQPVSAPAAVVAVAAVGLRVPIPAEANPASGPAPKAHPVAGWTAHPVLRAGPQTSVTPVTRGPVRVPASMPPTRAGSKDEHSYLPHLRAMLGIGAVVVVAIIGLVISFAVAAVLGVIGVICFVPLVIEKDGRSGYERALLMIQWIRAHRRGEHTYSSGTFSRIPGGRYRPPGVLADTEIYDGIDANNRRFGMIHMPSVAGYTGVSESSVRCASRWGRPPTFSRWSRWSRPFPTPGSNCMKRWPRTPGATPRSWRATPCFSWPPA